MRIDIPDQSRVIARYGEAEQVCTCLEELAELSIAVSKMHRMKNQDSSVVGAYYNLVEEMADVLIIILHLSSLLSDIIVFSFHKFRIFGAKVSKKGENAK